VTERATLAVGLMSGTSLDGMDAALVRFEGPTRATLLAFVTRPYSAEERGAIEAALEYGTPRSLALLHARIAHWGCDAVQAVLDAGRVSPARLDLIAFHGQTLWHEPPVVSFQLGEPAVLAERFRVRVVSGFRARDVAAGGQGAPLVPMADVLLFGADHPRILLNIGGMANLTYVPRAGVTEGAFGFDTGPGMAVIDTLARLADPASTFDRDGALARRGRVHEDVVRELLADAYFSQTPPKSTGRERFGHAYARALAARLPGPDGVATAVALTARSIAEAIRRWTPAETEVVASGGGTRHPVLMETLERELAGGGEGRAGGGGGRLVRFDDLFFPGDAKEAVAFALLGLLTVRGLAGNLPAATGADGPRVLGAVTPA
jgi:anhydro-N-acetylmuramic acid kinase